MGQHLYQCERCPKIGVAHYVLVPDATAPGGWSNQLICTACWTADQAHKKEEKARVAA